jgi:hypothetical protein
MPGKGDSGLMVCQPEPGRLKKILPGPGLVFTLEMASRNEPGPLSLALFTVKTTASLFLTAKTPKTAVTRTATERRPILLK